MPFSIDIMTGVSISLFKAPSRAAGKP